MYFARTLSNAFPKAFRCCARDPDEDELMSTANQAKTVAKEVLESACETPEGPIPGQPGEYFLQPWKIDSWKDCGTACVKTLYTVGGPGAAAIYIAGLLLSSDYGIGPEIAGAVGGATFALVSTVINSTPFSQWSIGSEAVRIGLTQLTTQSVATYAWRYALEQAAIHVNPALAGYPESVGNMTMPGNGTEGYGVDPQAMHLEWYSLTVVGVPFLIQLSALLFPPLKGMSGIDAFVNRLRFDGSKGDVVDRWGDRDRGHGKALAASAALKLGVVSVAVGLPVGLGLNGRMAMAHRLVVGWSTTLCAARLRDFINTAVRGVAPGGIVSFQRADDGWFRQKEVKIPQPVLDKLRDACTDMDKFKRAVNFAKMNRLARAKKEIKDLKEFYGGRKVPQKKKSEIYATAVLSDEEISEIQENFIDRGLYDKALSFLHDEYRDLFIDARFYSSFFYGLMSYGGLAAMREYFASLKIKGVFGRTLNSCSTQHSPP
jgi:hypothetical protein